MVKAKSPNCLCWKAGQALTLSYPNRELKKHEKLTRYTSNFLGILFDNFIINFLLYVSTDFHCCGIQGTGTNQCPQGIYIFHGHHLGCVIFDDLSILENKKTNTQCPQPGLKPRLLDLELSALTTRPLGLHDFSCTRVILYHCAYHLPCSRRLNISTILEKVNIN